MDSFQADKLQRLASRVQFKDFKKFRLKTKPDIYNKVLRFSEIAQKNETNTSKLAQEVREQVCSPKRRSHKIYKFDNINSGQNMKLKEKDQPEFCVAIDSSDFESNRNFNGNVNKDFDGGKCEKYVETSKNNAEISDRKYYYGDLCNFINQYVEPSFNESFSSEHFNRGNVLPNSLNEQDASIEYEDSNTCLEVDVAEINEPTIDSKICDFQSEAMFDDSQFDLSYVHKDALEDKIASIDENVLRNSFHLVDVKGTNHLYWDQCSYGIPLNNNNTSSRFRIATKPIDDDIALDEDDYDKDKDESYYSQNSSTPISPSCSTNTRSTEIQRSDSYFTDNSLQTYYKPVKHTRFKPASNETGTQTVAHKAVDAKPRLFYVDEKSKEGKGVIVPKTKKRRKDKNTFTNRLSGKPRNSSLEEIPSSEESDSYPENNNAEQKQIIIRWGNFSKMISSERIKKEHEQDDVKKEHKQDDVKKEHKDDVKKEQTEDDVKKEYGVITENKGIVTSFAATNGSYDLVSSASYDVVPTNFAGKFVDDEDMLSENFVEKVVLLERKCSSDYIDMDFEEVKTKSSKGCHDLMREFNRHSHNKAFASFNIGDSIQLCFSEKNAVNSNNHSSIDRELMSDYTSNIIECDDKNGFCINAASYPSNSGATKLNGFPKNFRKIKHSRICRRIKLNNNASPQCDNIDLGDCGNSQVVCCCHKGLNEASYCRSNCLVHNRKYNQLTIEDKSQMHNYRLSGCDINQEMDECDICKSVYCLGSEDGGDCINKFEERINSSNSCCNSELFFENVNNNNDFSNKSVQSMFDMCHNEDCHHNQDVTSLMCPHDIQRLSELLRRLQKSLLLPDCNKTFPQKVSLNSSSEDNYSKLSENGGQGETRFNDKSEFHELLLLSDLNNFQSQDVITTDLPFENQNEVSTNQIINPVNQLEEGSGVRYKSPQVTQNVPAKISKPSINKDRSSRGYGKDKCNKMRIRIKTGYETDISESDYSGCDVNRHRKSTRIRFFKSRSRRSIQNKTRRCRLSSSESSNSEERNKKLFGKKILKCRSEMKYKEIDDNNNNTSRRYYSPAHHHNKFIMKDIKWPSKSSKESRNLYPMNVTNYPDDYELKSVKRMFKERDIIRKFLISELERLRESLEKERRTFLGELSATRQQIKDYEQNQRRKMEHLESLVCQRLECYDRMIHNQNACPYSPCPYNEPVAIIPNDNRFYASNYDPNFAMTHLKSSTTLNDQMNLKPLAISNYHPNFEQFSTLRHNEFVSSDMKGENIQNYHIKSRDLQQFIPTNGRFLPPTLALKNEKTLKKENAAYSRRRHSVNGSARDTSNLKENVSGKWMNLENKPYEGPFFNTSPRTRFESDFAPHTNFTKVRDSYLDLPVKSPNLHNFEKNCKIQSLGNKIENKVYHSTATQYPKQTRSNQVTPQTKHSSNQTVQPVCSNKLTQRNISPIGTSCDRSFLSSEVEKVMRSSLASEKQEPYKTLLANKITTIARSPAINVTHFSQINQDIAPEMKPTTIDFKKNHSKNNNNSYNATFKSTEPDVVLASDRKPEINQNRGQDSLRRTDSENVFFPPSNPPMLSSPPTTTHQESIIPRENFKDSLDLYIHDVQKSNRTNRSETSQKFKSVEGFIFTEGEICRKNWKGIHNNDGSIKTLFSRWTVI